MRLDRDDAKILLTAYEKGDLVAQAVLFDVLDRVEVASLEKTSIAAILYLREDNIG